MENEKRRRKTFDDESLYTKFGFASLFLFVIPVLLALYIIFFILPEKLSAKAMDYVRIIIVCMVASGILGFFLIRRIAKSILSLIARAKNIAQGKIEEKIEVTHQDELKDLAQAVNRITRDLEGKIKELEYSRILTRELFQKIGQTITSAHKMDALLSLITQSMRKVLKADTSFIALYDNKDGRLYLKAYAGPQKDLSENMILPDDKGVIGFTIKNAKSMAIRKAGLAQASRDASDDKIAYNNILCVPIIDKGRVVGVFGAADLREAEKDDSENMFLMENISSQIAASVENFELNRDIEETYYQTLVTLARVVAAKDIYSAGHLERVSGYVEKMADRLRLDEETRKTLMGGAILHDLGKVGIQDSILLKQDALGPEEYEIMKQHSIIGENILKPLRSMSKLSELIRHHHELYDGSGYPDGLKGDQIPITSRILTIADMYDALRTNRPYKKALSEEESIKTIRGYAGTKLDPKLTEVFIEILIQPQPQGSGRPAPK